jgi:protein-S-isoprenylcysteine O-methyltransferase Ste14
MMSQMLERGSEGHDRRRAPPFLGHAGGSALQRWGVLAYGVGCYVVFLGTFLYAIGFVGNVAVPWMIDAPAETPLAIALLIDVLLLTVFAFQHSGMARPAFKRWWTRLVPSAVERSTYVLFSSLALVLLFWLWRPLDGVVWDVEHPSGRLALHSLCALGWLTVLATTFLINHFDLFGLRQVWLYFHRRPYISLGFVTPGPYRLVRHPLYVGWLIAFWATPTMTAAHLLFALGTTVYILVAIRFEERDLLAAFGRSYAEYRARVPMLVPELTRRGEEPQPLSQAAIPNRTPEDASCLGGGERNE